MFVGGHCSCVYCPWRPEENIGFYRSGGPGNCDLSEVGGGNSSAASARAVCALNHGVISSP